LIIQFAGEPTNYGLGEKQRQKWSEENADILSGLSSRINTTYRTSYLPWSQSLYLAKNRRASRSNASVVTERLNAGTYCTSRRTSDKPRISATVSPASIPAHTTAPMSAPCRPAVNGSVPRQATTVIPAAATSSMERNATIVAL